MSVGVCVPFDLKDIGCTSLNSFSAQVCTFRLIVKNAASLLGSKDPVKLEAEAILDDLVR